MTRLSIAVVLLACVPSAVVAQTQTTDQSLADTTEAKFQFGPLGLTPRVALKDIGFDTNPLNLPGERDRDFTFTVAPGLDSWLRFGRGQLISKTTVDYVHFNQSRTQRSFNVGQDLRAELSLNRLTPFVAGSYLRTRQRPNLEIDERVQQNVAAEAVGTRLRLGSRTNLELQARRQTLRYAEGKYGDSAIGYALDRDTDAFAVSSRFTLTPLTTFVVRGEGSRDRFRVASHRDSNSIRVLPGFELKPSALIAGRIAVGFRGFDAQDLSVPDFGGVVGQIDARYTLREATQFAIRAERDIEYSIEDDQPYFVLNGGGLQVTQILGSDWFVIGRGSRARLAYRDFITSALRTSQPLGRSDRVNSYGFGFGRRLGDDIRVSFDVNRVARKSPLPTRQFEGVRYGISISYGS